MLTSSTLSVPSFHPTLGTFSVYAWVMPFCLIIASYGNYVA